MDLGRASKYGAIGACGAILITLGTAGLMWLAWADRISGTGVVGTLVLIAIAGTASAILFLFVVIGAFLDQELQARGLDSSEGGE